MAHVRVIHNPIGETLTVYFAEPRSDQVCEETGGGVILIKDRKSGEVIGFERLYYKAAPGPHTVTVETLEGVECPHSSVQEECYADPHKNP